MSIEDHEAQNLCKNSPELESKPKDCSEEESCRSACEFKVHQADGGCEGCQ